MNNVLKKMIFLLILAAALCIAIEFFMFAYAKKKDVGKTQTTKIAVQKDPAHVSVNSRSKKKAKNIQRIKVSATVASTTITATGTEERGQVLGAYEEFVNDTSSIPDVSAPVDQQANFFSVDPPISSAAPSSFGGVAAMPPLPVITEAIVSIATSTEVSGISTTTIFQQLEDTSMSGISWYDDNWFELGNGFAGTLRTLTLRGKVSDPHYAASHIYLQEFKDPNYRTEIQEFTVSDNAPFTPVMATTTFEALSIRLKPYFYYRLATSQDYQNRSVLLAGTAATGTAMTDHFLYGVGRQESTSTFFPFMIMEGAAPTSTLLPPPITSPKDLVLNFDQLNMQLSASFSASTDPDWPGNPLHYEMNYSTSSSFDGGWKTPGIIPVSMGNTYIVGVRAVDDFGVVSQPVTSTWSFPTGFVPYILSGRLTKATQDFILPVGGLLQSIELFGANFATGARNPDGNGCGLTLLDTEQIDPQMPTHADNGYGGYACGGHMVFSFAPSSTVLLPGHPYQWAYQIYSGPPPYEGSAQLFGVNTNNASGSFSDPSVVNAKFIINGTSSILFAN